MSQYNMFLNTFYSSFENAYIDTSLLSIPLDNANFGILSLAAVSSNITVKEQEFVFVIDRSGSMSDRCSDGRTKMQHIIHTLKNMILYFHENPAINLHVTVFAFDNEFIDIIKRTRIRGTNLQEILTKIDEIRPMGGTDIELALQKTGKYIAEIKNDYPQHIISHIFMTDGDATAGNNDYNVLKGLVDPEIENAFIGFGIHHDSALLTHISSYNKSSYHFIDALEKAGLVYGEILHGILYKYLTDVEICVENGFVYNYTDNQWVNKLFIGDIVGEANKTYHLISNIPDSCKIILNCKNSGDEYSFQASQLINPLSNHKSYIYRQKTLELLFQVSQVQKNKMQVRKIYDTNFSLFAKNTDDNTYVSKMNKLNDEEHDLKLRLRTFFQEIKNYMLDNNLNQDKFLKNLCDDIYITYRTLGTKYGDMYTCARQTSQGTQRCYTVSYTPDDEENETNRFSPINNNLTLLRPQRSFRQTRGFHTPNLFGDLINHHCSNDIQHNLSSFDDAPYLIPTATTLMRDVSSSREYVVPMHDIDAETQPI